MPADRAIVEPVPEPSLGNEAEAFVPQRPLPAWLMSVVLHGTILLILALTIRAVPTQAPGDESDRSVGIAFRGETTESPDEFTDEDSSSSAAPAGQPLSQSEALPEASETPVDLTGFLPSGDSAPAPGNLESLLPGAGAMTDEVGTSTAGTGEKARTSVFGAQGVGTEFVYVFDRSGSMDGYRGRPMRAAKAALLNSLNDLSRTHQFQIIFYNEFPQEFTLPGETPRMHFGDDNTKDMATRFVEGVTATGGTRHMDALKLALRMRPDVIFFLTDANEPRLSPEQLAELGRINGGGTTINAIEFGYGPTLGEDNFLRQLARQNGGQHVYVDISRLPRE